MIEMVSSGSWAKVKVCDLIPRIPQRMAKESFILFMQQLNAGDDDLRIKTAQILFDLLMVHDIASLVQDLMPVSPTRISSRVFETDSKDSRNNNRSNRLSAW
jgi:hypothetical protein